MRAPFGCILVGICAGLLASPGEAQNARAAHSSSSIAPTSPGSSRRRVTAIPTSKHLSPPSKKTHAKR